MQTASKFEVEEDSMSQMLSINVPDQLLDRLNRLAQAAARPVEELIVSTLNESVPHPPANLPPEIREELTRLERMSDEELGDVARLTLRSVDIPAAYQPGDVTDQLALRKAYALVLWKWRGHSLDEVDLQPSAG
jgi:predicted transcriptional regulator